MIDPLSILGAAASSLQIAEMICNLGIRIIAKPKDNKSLQEIHRDSLTYILCLEGWEGQMDGEAKAACKNLRLLLKLLVSEIDSLKERKRSAKVITALKLYSSDYEQKLKKGLEDFKLHMLIEGQKKSAAANVKLGEMTEKLKELHISTTTLNVVPTTIELQIRDLSETISDIKSGISRLQAALNDLPDISPIVPQITLHIDNDGNATRELIAQSTETIMSGVKTNESACRITAEILPSSECVTWYGEESNPPFAVWSLDEGGTADQNSTPSARFNGIALTSTPSIHTIDDVLSKRHLGDEFDQNISRMKRRRTKEISPYIALANHDNRLQTLREYVPPALAKELSEKLPRDVLKQVLRTSRTLSQEYQFTFLDRFRNDGVSSLPKLSLLEDMERAMLALQADKIKISLDFFKPHEIQGKQCCYDITINLSSQANLYNETIWEVYSEIMQKLLSKGTAGRSTIVRACLSMFNRNMESRYDIIRLFQSLFQNSDSYDFYLDESVVFLSPRLDADVTRAGTLIWHGCDIESPCTRLTFGGEEICSDYWTSLAEGSAECLGLSAAMNVLKNATDVEPRNTTYWFMLAETYNRLGDYHSAIQVCQKFHDLRFRENSPQCPSDSELLFGHEIESFWNLFGSLHMKIGNYEAAVRVLQEDLTWAWASESRALCDLLKESYITLDKHDEARQLSLDKIEKWPPETFSLNHLGQWYNKIEEIAETMNV